MDDPHLEPIALEAEVALDQSHESLHRRVPADGSAPAAQAVRAREAGLEAFLKYLPQHPLERAPVRALELLQDLTLSHV